MEPPQPQRGLLQQGCGAQGSHCPLDHDDSGRGWFFSSLFPGQGWHTVASCSVVSLGAGGTWIKSPVLLLGCWSPAPGPAEPEFPEGGFAKLRYSDAKQGWGHWLDDCPGPALRPPCVRVLGMTQRTISPLRPVGPQTGHRLYLTSPEGDPGLEPSARGWVSQ